MFRIPVRLAESGGHSDPRNPNMRRMLVLTGLVERTGSGLYRVLEMCRGMGLGMPTITEAISSTVTVSIKLTGGRMITSVESEQGLLDVIRSNPEITRRRWLGLRVCR